MGGCKAPLGHDEIRLAPDRLGWRAGLDDARRDRDRQRRAQFRTVGSRLDAEQHVQRVHRRLEPGFQDRDLRLDLSERTLGLVHLEFGSDSLSVQERDQSEQLPAGLGLLPGNREPRLQAPDRDVHIRGVRGDGEPCRDHPGFGCRVLRAGSFPPASQTAEHVGFPARAEVHFVGTARAVDIGRGGKHLSQGGVVGAFIVAVLGVGVVKQQFFPTSDRPEVLVEVQMPYGTSIEQTNAATAKVEAWLAKQPEATIVTAYVGQGSPRFYLAMAPELPDPSFAKVVVLTDSEEAREALTFSLRQAVADGLAPEARVRVTQLVFGPYSPFPVAFRVMGPDPDTLREIAAQVLAVMHASPLMRTTNTDWGERVPSLRFALDQDRLQSIGLTSSDIAQQLQFLLTGIPITDVREDIRSVQVTARSAGHARLDPSRIGDFTLVGAAGQRIPLSQIGTVAIRMEDPILRRRDRTPTITVRGDIADGLQPPDVSTAVWKELQPIIAQLPAGYRIEQGGSIEESGKANRALAPLFPIMIALTLITIIFQVRSISMMTMLFATAPLGLIGVIPTLLLFTQPFGINALVGLIALSGILMRNTLILIGQIRHNEKEGLAPFDAVVEATVQRSRPVILTALAAMLAFIPLTHSVFWGTLAYTLIGGTFGGTVLTLVFLPALYAIWFKIKPAASDGHAPSSIQVEPVAG
jgi:multidrug efflux pump subunit AcrB